MYDIVSGPKSTVFGISAKYLSSRIDTYLCMIGTTLTLDKKPWGMVIIKSYVPSFGISFLSDLDNNHYLPMYNRYREDTFPGSGIPIYFLLVLSCLLTSGRVPVQLWPIEIVIHLSSKTNWMGSLIKKRRHG